MHVSVVVGLDNWLRDRMPGRFAVHIQQDFSPELAEKIERLFFSLDIMTAFPVVGSYGLESEIVEWNAVDGCGERTKFQDHR